MKVDLSAFIPLFEKGTLIYHTKFMFISVVTAPGHQSALTRTVLFEELSREWEVKNDDLNENYMPLEIKTKVFIHSYRDSQGKEQHIVAVLDFDSLSKKVDYLKGLERIKTVEVSPIGDHIEQFVSNKVSKEQVPPIVCPAIENTNRP